MNSSRAISHQKPSLWLADPAFQPIRGLVFGKKWLKFIFVS